MISGASESSREARREPQDRSAPSGARRLSRLELVLVVEGLAASVLGARDLEAGAGPAQVTWVIALGVGAVLVPCGLARTTWGARIARPGMATALTLLALFLDSTTSGAFPLVPHLVVIALLMTAYRDPAVVAVVGLITAGATLARAVWRVHEPPVLSPQDAAWLVVALCLVAALTEHVRGLGEALVAERSTHETTRRRRSQGQAGSATDGDLVDATERTPVEQTHWLAALSHELRTPLHAVVGFLELLARSPLSEAQRRHVEGANTSAQHVLGLVADVLETAKIESGALELEREPFDVRGVIREAVRLVEGTARERAVSLDVALGDDLATQLAGDALRLRQILINLLGNAVKYARSRVVVRAVWVGETDALQIDVEDDGPGIPEGRAQRVFQPYRQADRGTARRHGGTGLGLSISRRLARLMRGDVLVRSSSSSGTTFRFFAPLPRADGTAAPPAANDCAPVAPLRVLLADDDASNRLVTSELLRLLGHTVTQTEDGQQALEQALHARHDLVVLDVEMPGLSGPEVARRVRAAGNQVAIIGLTGHGGREGRLTYLRAGMDAVVVKPADLVHLRDAITAAFASRALLPDAQSGAEPAPSVDRSHLRGTASQEVMRELGSGLDLDDLRHRAGGDEELAVAVLAAVRDESARLFRELSEAVREGDVEAMRVVAHTLKGCVANVGARPVREAVTAVENAAKSGERQRAIELATHALVLGTSLSAALAHACRAAEHPVEREGAE